MGVARPVWGVGGDGGRVMRAAGRRGCWGGVWGGEVEEAESAMTTQGRLRADRGSAPPPSAAAVAGPTRPRALSGSRSVGGAAGTGRSHLEASPRGPTDAVSAAPAAPSEGWTVGCQSRGTRAPQPRSGGVSVVVGRGATLLRRGVAAAPGRAMRAVPCRGRGAPSSMEIEAERSASKYGKKVDTKLRESVVLE